MTAIVHASNDRWITIYVRVNGQQVDITPVLRDLLLFLKQRGQQFFFGSLTVQMSQADVEQLAQLPLHTGDYRVVLKDALENTQADASDFICENNWSAYSDEVFYAAMQNEGDVQKSEEFYNAFNSLFVLTQVSKTFSVKKNRFKDIILFCIRFAHKIQELSGLQAIVPKLSESNTRAENQKELMRAFVSIYPAYHHYCTTMRIRSKFYWDYTVDTDGKDS